MTSMIYLTKDYELVDKNNCKSVTKVASVLLNILLKELNDDGNPLKLCNVLLD